jgi:hypothetical protein
LTAVSGNVINTFGNIEGIRETVSLVHKDVNLAGVKTILAMENTSKKKQIL